MLFQININLIVNLFLLFIIFFSIYLSIFFYNNANNALNKRFCFSFESRQGIKDQRIDEKGKYSCISIFLSANSLRIRANSLIDYGVID